MIKFGKRQWTGVDMKTFVLRTTPRFFLVQQFAGCARDFGCKDGIKPNSISDTSGMDGQE